MQIQHVISIIFIAVSSNLDNIALGTSYGIRKIRISFSSNLLIAAVTSFATVLSIILGESVYFIVSERTAELLGGSIIGLVGLWIVFQENIARRPLADRNLVTLCKPELSTSGSAHVMRILDSPIIAEWGFCGAIDLKETMALAFGLTINNIPNGVGAGMLGLNAYAMTTAVFLVSIITIWIGTYLGYLGVHWVGKSAGMIAGLLLIFAGLCDVVS